MDLGRLCSPAASAAGRRPKARCHRTGRPSTARAWGRHGHRSRRRDRKAVLAAGAQARADNACLGPLRNDADLWLTGTVVKRIAAHYPPPPHAVAPKPKDRQDELRGLAAGVDPEGFLWLTEQRMSRSALEASAVEGSD